MIIPKRLLIEVTDYCNAECDYCLRSLLKRGIFHLPIDIYKRWVKSAPYASWIQPQGIGEPLMYPWIAEALSYAKAQGKRTMFYTNASLLVKGMSERILDAGIDYLTFSVDGYDARTFASRAGLSWKKVYANILGFQHLRDKGGYETRTIIRATITDLNKWRIPNFFLFWRGKVDDVRMSRNVRFPTPEQLSRTPYAHGKGFQCYHIFDLQPRPTSPVITILNDGNVVLCCQDWFSDYIMGNLYEQSILDAFNSPQYEKIRQGMTAGTKYPYLCEFCRLAKIHKKHTQSPYQMIAEIMACNAYRGKIFSVAKAIIRG